MSAPTETQPARMGDADSRESRMVVIERDEAGTPTVWCDPEIADLVTALNKGGIPTIASCSGHGEKWGNIALKDGRELLIAPNYEAARARELSAHGGDGGSELPEGHPQAPMPSGWLTLAVPCGDGRHFVHGPEIAIEACKAALATQQPASGEVVAHAGNELPRMVAYHAAHKRAADATLEANGIGGPARERAADEACRYFFNHFGDWIVPKPNVTTPAIAAHGGSGEESERFPVDEGTRGQVAAVMLMSGTPEQKAEAERWLQGDRLPTPPTSASDAEVAVAEAVVHRGMVHLVYRKEWLMQEGHRPLEHGTKLFTRSPAAVGGRDYEALYMDLIYQVGNKYPGESRHDTAKRYLQRAEQSGDSQVAKQASP